MTSKRPCAVHVKSQGRMLYMAPPHFPSVREGRYRKTGFAAYLGTCTGCTQLFARSSVHCRRCTALLTLPSIDNYE